MGPQLEEEEEELFCLLFAENVELCCFTILLTPRMENTPVTRIDMFGQNSDQIPVTFQDVAVCFSEEEWKLLNEWQKHLYENVMKEIHQALKLLGYKILNPDTLLRIYKGKELYIHGSQAEERSAIDDPTSSCLSLVSPDILLRIKHEEAPNQSYLHYTEKTGIGDSSSTGDSFESSPVKFMLKRKEASRLKVPQDAHEREGVSCLSTSQVEEPSVISFIIKDEDNPYPMHHQDSDFGKRLNIPIDDKYMIRKGKGGKIVTYNEATIPAKSSEKKNVPGSFLNRIHPQSHHWRNTSLEQEGDLNIHREHGLRNRAYSTLYPEIPKAAMFDKYDTCDKTLESSSLHVCTENTQKYLRKYKCTECEEIFLESRHLIRHLRTHSGKRSYPCTICNKGFSQKHHLILHQRIHTGEKPYQCTECKKRFSRKEVLITHQRTHTGERPYHCTHCLKSFTQKGSLIAHERTHTGERPYHCIQCKKGFTRKKSLIAHQSMHTE